MHMNISEEAVDARIYNENAPHQDLDNPAAQTLCEPAQSKCGHRTRMHKGTFMRIYRKNAAPQRAYPDHPPYNIKLNPGGAIL